MKKLLFLTVLSLLYCNLSAQNVNDNDFLILQKSNAYLKTQLNEQKQTLLKQIEKTDSIVSILQSANSEIKKNADNQTSISQLISDLNKKITNISLAFIERKTYTIFAVIVSIVMVLLYLLYMKKKLSAIKKDNLQTEMDLNNKISKTNDYINMQMVELKILFEKQTKETNLVIEKQVKEINQTIEKQGKEINQAIEKQTAENNNRLTKLSTDTNESINDLSNGFNMSIESQVTSAKVIFHEQLSQSANEFSGKITEINKTFENKIAAIKNELSANMNEINVRLKDVNPKS